MGWSASGGRSAGSCCLLVRLLGVGWKRCFCLLPVGLRDLFGGLRGLLGGLPFGLFGLAGSLLGSFVSLPGSFVSGLGRGTRRRRRRRCCGGSRSGLSCLGLGQHRAGKSHTRGEQSSDHKLTNHNYSASSFFELPRTRHDRANTSDMAHQQCMGVGIPKLNGNK